jgi:diadenosine tetraphosphate (Ap4A) HIT family hydrolase
VSKPHAIEIYDLSDEESAAFMRDVRVASLALMKVTAAIKINYAIQGNTIPHMHMHLYPRQKGDPFENGPVDWRTRTSKLYRDGEFEAFIEAMKTAVQEVEQAAAADADKRRR